MSTPYDITVLYSVHESQMTVPAFPEQTLAKERIEVIPIFEPDPCHPRRKALSAVSQAKGYYTILLDAGDSFEPSFLETLLLQAALVGGAFTMSGQLCRHVSHSTEYFYLKTKGTSVQNVEKLPTVFPTELHGLLFPTKSLLEAIHRTTGQEEQEKQILLYLLDKNPEFPYVGSQILTYDLPRECDPPYDIRPLTRAWYFEPLTAFLLPLLEREHRERGRVRFFLQCLALYMVNLRLTANMDNQNKHAIEPAEVPAYTALLSDILQYVSTASILDTTVHPANKNSELRITLLRMKRRDWSWYPELDFQPTTIRFACEGQRIVTLPKVPIRIQLIDYKEGRWEIDGSYLDHFPHGRVRIYAKLGGKTYDLDYNRRYSLTKYFGTSFYRMETFHLSLPVDEAMKEAKGELLLNFYAKSLSPKQDGSTEYRMAISYPSHTSRFAGAYAYTYWKFGKFLAFQNEKGIHICPTSPLTVMKKELMLWRQILKRPADRKYLPLKMANFLLRPWFSRQRIWMFMDKIYKGGDSSEYIYKYACAQKDGIKKYYLLDKGSADYARLQREGYKPLRRGSIRHRLIFLNANLVIASNSTVFAFNSYSAAASQNIRGDVHFDVACVQHGMSIQQIAIAQQRLRDNTKLYFCASRYEMKNLSHPAYDYLPEHLKLTGVPRYDGLKDRAEKILLFSPTWRMNSALPPTRGESVAREYNPHFKESNYFKVYNGLMNDPRLLEAARKFGYRIQYVLHPIISPQAEDFTKNELVEIIPSIGDMSYEKLFCESALMVTDFSGVQFDFAYMRKPVVYLHHEDIPQHYEEGSFFYETMGFGEICRNNAQLIETLCRYMENDCRMPDEYRRRADDFFHYSDHNNCERIYKEMVAHEMSHGTVPWR